MDDCLWEARSWATVFGLLNPNFPARVLISPEGGRQHTQDLKTKKGTKDKERLLKWGAWPQSSDSDGIRLLKSEVFSESHWLIYFCPPKLYLCDFSL